MPYYPLPILSLINHIAKLPGIGRKTAERLALHILRTSRIEAEQLAQSILDVRDKIRLCTRCFGLSDQAVCHICIDPARKSDVLCVVEQPADMVAIEKSGAFRGKYHILQGALSPIDGIGPDNIRFSELILRVREEKIREVVIATSTGVDGEATAALIAQSLKPFSVNLTRIASGIPMGGDIQYVDEVTLKRAMEGRYAV